jgi:formylglycine-generating enzyme required for sulfatase activity
MKSTTLRILCPVLLLVAGTLAVHAAQFGDFTYESNGTEITITGYTGSGGDVIIPDSIAGLPITGIGDFALMDCASLISITIPDSVTSIGTHAFGGCSNLTSVGIPNGVSSIENGAFSACSSLTSIMIPNGVTFIGEWAFDGCHSLAKITIADGVIGIAQAAFRNCTSLTSIIIPDSVLTIEGRVSLGGGGAFEGCIGLTTVYFYGDAPTMSGDVFKNTMATLFYMPGTTGWGATIAGRPTVQWNGVFGAQSLDMFAGLTVIGEIGKVYSIEYVTDLTDPAESDWRCLEYLQLPASPYLWADKSAPATGKRFYRAREFPASTNMVFIPPGTFRMGSPADEEDREDWEGPQTAVTISRGFWMGKYEVTQGEYLELMGNNPSAYQLPHYPGDTTHPVEMVSWVDATNYCTKLTERERVAGRIGPNAVYRLPTEAEWEYACRAWTSTRFSYGDDPGYTNLTNYAGLPNYGNQDCWTDPVGQRLPNPWGLYDMHGNVQEWCEGWWSDRLPGGIALDPQGPTTGEDRVIRGGSFHYWIPGITAHIGRSARRSMSGTDGGGAPWIGLRAVLAPGQP